MPSLETPSLSSLSAKGLPFLFVGWVKELSSWNFLQLRNLLRKYSLALAALIPENVVQIVPEQRQKKLLCLIPLRLFPQYC